MKGLLIHWLQSPLSQQVALQNNQKSPNLSRFLLAAPDLSLQRNEHETGLFKTHGNAQ